MGLIVSVNIGLPREVDWQGRTVRTAIWKEPVPRRVFAGRLNLVGDGQADLKGHGGEQRAIMVYQMDSYRYWAKYLGRDDLAFGNFGENLTVEGLSDAEVCIGDRYRIGGAVVEVSQPRVTCYKVGLRLGLPEMPALLVAHKRPGFYLRVIEPGEIGAGDRIEKVGDGPERMTVAEIDALLYSADHPQDALRRAVWIGALSPGWQASMQSLLAAAEDGQRSGNAGLTAAPAQLAWQGFRPLKITASKMESAEIRSFELAAEDGTALPSAIAGQHILVRVRPAPDGDPVTRNYSLCGPVNGATYRIAVKDERGRASGFLHEHASVGQLLEASAPRGSFTLSDGPRPLVLLSAGVGVTPMLGMLHAVAATDAVAPRQVWWLHAARDGAHDAFASETRALLGKLAEAHRCVVYSRSAAGDRLGEEYDRQGRISEALLEEIAVPTEADFYLCGPPGFLAVLDAALRSRGVDGADIHIEAFGPGQPASGVAPHPPAGPPGDGPLVTFARSRLAVPWDPRFTSLLELAEACSVPVRWSCRAGVCHNCESGLIDGRLDYEPQPLDRPAAGNVLLCCAKPLSAVELDL
jgi:ferredoxin-NADP reductase/MOSC domain-containing protein YiiM